MQALPLAKKAPAVPPEVVQLACGTVVLHVCPEAAVGGPLALVRDGDVIELDVPRRSLNVLITDEELSRRRTDWQAPPPKYSRGYGKLFIDHVLQADEGCDFDFCRGGTAIENKP